MKKLTSHKSTAALAIRSAALVVLVAALSLTGCKKDEPACEEWTEGIEFYKITVGDPEPICRFVGNWKYDDDGRTTAGRSPFVLSLTVPDPQCDVDVYGTDKPFESGEVYLGTDPASGTVDNALYNHVNISYNVQHDVNGATYFNTPLDSRFEIESIDYTTNTLTGVLTYEFGAGSPSGGPRVPTKHEIRFDNVSFVNW